MVRKLVPGEEHELCVKQTRQIWAAAVIEHGEAFVKDSNEVVKAKDVVNISAALGINSSCSIRSHGGRACQITIVDRVTFWDLLLLFPKAKEGLYEMGSGAAAIGHHELVADPDAPAFGRLPRLLPSAGGEHPAEGGAAQDAGRGTQGGANSETFTAFDCIFKHFKAF